VGRPGMEGIWKYDFLSVVWEASDMICRQCPSPSTSSRRHFVDNSRRTWTDKHEELVSSCETYMRVRHLIVFWAHFIIYQQPTTIITRAKQTRPDTRAITSGYYLHFNSGASEGPQSFTRLLEKLQGAPRKRQKASSLPPNTIVILEKAQRSQWNPNGGNGRGRANLHGIRSLHSHNVRKTLGYVCPRHSSTVGRRNEDPVRMYGT
jgi:hypothetical protein